MAREVTKLKEDLAPAQAKGIPPEWTFVEKNTEKNLLLQKQIKQNIELFDTLRVIFEKKFEEIEVKEFTFDSPAFTERLIFLEGYKKAIRDLYRLLPK